MATLEVAPAAPSDVAPRRSSVDRGPRSAPKKQASASISEQASDVQQLILSCNKDGMESLRAGHQKAAFDQFKYAEAILLANQVGGDSTALLSVTCNNLGCYYKKVGKFHGALNYLRRALKMEVELKTDEVTLAGTHLNLCSVLSKLEKHDKAVQHALSALELMSRRVTQSQEIVSQEDYSVLAVAYHNLAGEKEFLEQWDQAATAYQTGHQVAKRFLGEENPISQSLAKRCEAVLQKARKPVKAAGRKTDQPRPSVRDDDGRLPEITPRGGTGSRPGSSSGLPPLTPGSRPGSSSSAAPPIPSARGNGKDWAAQERDSWAAFASKTLQGSSHDRAGSASPAGSARGSLLTEARASTAPAGAAARSLSLGSRAESPRSGGDRGEQLAAMALSRVQQRIPQQILELEDVTSLLPTARNMGHHKFMEKLAPGLLKEQPLARALSDHPDKLMDIIDNEAQSHGALRLAANDYRPNRSMTRSTRTSRLVRRTGVHNSTLHRDRVSANLEKRRTANPAGKSPEVMRQAAERIQRVWRAWYTYCQDNSEYMTMTWICATMIQSQWRSYHVRRMKMDANALNIQRRVRGWLVRSVLKCHAAAVTIQRRVIGMLTRMKLMTMHKACMRIQRLIRGHIARHNFRRELAFKRNVCTTIQRNMRVCIVKRVFKKMLAKKRAEDLKLQCVIDFQRYFRGYKGRQRAERKRQASLADFRLVSATKLIQAHTRRLAAARRADGLREKRQQDMNRASTVLRKMYLGHQTRKRYLELIDRFRAAERQIVCIQRFMRGFVTRARLFREAVRAEEELWAAVEMQRAWRGYVGRVTFEHRYESMWRCEMAAAVIQRHIRGGLARRRTTKVKRKLARAEFEKARARFRAATRIQAIARGVINRRVTIAHRDRCRRAAVYVQKIHRGHAIRAQLWSHAREQRATMIVSVARGFLVRRRRARVIAAVIFLQRSWRKWLNVPKFFRQKRVDKAAHRRKMARAIQTRYRSYASAKRVELIKASGHLSLTDATDAP